MVTYSKPPTVLEILTGSASQAALPKIDANLLLELAVPRALYLFTAAGSLAGAGMLGAP